MYQSSIACTMTSSIVTSELGGSGVWVETKQADGYRIAGWLFPRLLALIYLLAFWSWGVQWQGLVGPEGIAPLEDLMASLQAYEDREGTSLLGQFPTVFHWRTDAIFVEGVIWTCGILCLVVMAGGLQGPLLLVIWMGYLSLVVTGDVFMGYQWDALLLEAGLLGVLVGSWRWWQPLRPDREPPRVAWWLVWWLVFRLMFLSGFVKWAGGDEVWREGTALLYHYQTQPIPNGVAWFAHHLPRWVHVTGCWIMFGIELVLPFAILWGRWGRRLAATGFAVLMLLVMATGNYTFFNLLTLVLTVTLVDDRAWHLRKWGRAESEAAGTSFWRQGRQWPALLGALPVVMWTLTAADGFLQGRVAGHERLLPEWCHRFYGAVAPLRSFNAYGLFQTMTTERMEITLEVSDDGLLWLPLEFKWKPGDLSRRPAQVAPHQPRLDWQMWFAAFSPGYLPDRDGKANSPVFWFGQFAQGLLRHQKPIWDLVEAPPIEMEKITHLRARYWRYHFTTPEERRESGGWWRREFLGFYTPSLSLPPSHAGKAEGGG